MNLLDETDLSEELRAFLRELKKRNFKHGGRKIVTHAELLRIQRMGLDESNFVTLNEVMKLAREPEKQTSN